MALLVKRHKTHERAKQAAWRAKQAVSVPKLRQILHLPATQSVAESAEAHKNRSEDELHVLAEEYSPAAFVSPPDAAAMSLPMSIPQQPLHRLPKQPRCLQIQPQIQGVHASPRRPDPRKAWPWSFAPTARLDPRSTPQRLQSCRCCPCRRGVLLSNAANDCSPTTAADVATPQQHGGRQTRSSPQQRCKQGLQTRHVRKGCDMAAAKTNPKLATCTVIPNRVRNHDSV